MGPSIRQAEAAIEKTENKLVYISMGTVNNDLLPLYKACITAFCGTEYQVILSVGDLVDRDAFGEIPDNISVYSKVDQIAVLRQADVFLTHCGMNSVSEALNFGVPLVMLPKTSEQKGVAFRVSQLGAGIYLEKETPEAILSAVKKVLEDPSYIKNTEMISADFRACSGARGAADKILSRCQ